LDEVPDLRLVFDTGNPIFQRDRSKPEPIPWQSAFEFYQKVKHAIAHIHVKDGIMHDEEGEPEYTFAGEGSVELEKIFKDLKKENYQGFVAIEPHMGKVFHLKDQKEDPEFAYNVYKRYGQRFENFLNQI
jgi:sugar phosphate isomerase/epimerase